MQTGQALREARLKRGLDLYEVKRVTKISVPVLRAMEEDRWEDVPAPGPEALVEIYATFLGLDEQSLPAEPDAGEPHDRRHTRSVLVAIAFAALIGVAIGLVGLGPLGGSGGGGATVTTGVEVTTTPTTPEAPVSLQISTHALVWVCLVDQRGHPVINGVDLVRDQTVGPYDGKAFEVTFGNGKVDLSVNGKAVNVPPIAAPLGYRITPDGATRLAPGDEPTCT